MDGCTWCLCNEKMKKYHDEEWGVPLHDDHRQFEFLMMEVMQCGLNWNMMIQKREIFRQCFDGFDYDRIAVYTEADIERILSCEGMIKSRRKVEAVIHNARCFQKVREEYGSFSSYIWSFSRGKRAINGRISRGWIKNAFVKASPAKLSPASSAFRNSISAGWSDSTISGASRVM